MTAASSITLTFAGTARIIAAPTFAELRRILSNTIREGDHAVLDGAAAPGDGRGGLFVYVRDSTDDDDGVTIIRPVDRGPTESGRWKLIARTLAGNASEIAYGGEYASVRDALDALLYVSSTISNFVTTPAVAEVGSTVPSVALSWTLNKPVSSQTIPGIPLDPGTRVTSATGPFTADHSWTLTADDGKTSVSATATLQFQQKRYWGVSASPTLTNDQVLALSSEFATNRNKTVIYDASGGAYPYFCYPVGFGEPSVTVGGLSFSDINSTIQTATNASGYASSYRVVRFNGLQTGSAIVATWG